MDQDNRAQWEVKTGPPEATAISPLLCWPMGGRSAGPATDNV
jgi:hypothetical protein